MNGVVGDRAQNRLRRFRFKVSGWPYLIDINPNTMLITATISKLEFCLTIGHASKFYRFSDYRTYCRLVVRWQPRQQGWRHTQNDYQIARM